VVATPQRDEESDEQLLHAFLLRQDDTAFAILVRRYGPMVAGVCRRVLQHTQDAEDAVQATFLVLARNAGRLRKKTALASWLYGTAYRMALTARRAAARRRKYEGQTPPRQAGSPPTELLWHEVRTLLDEEISLLPDAYRGVFVLCCMESLSRTEVARRLGLKVGTVSSRLAEARKRLQRRLARRGVELTAVLAAAALAIPQVSALSFARLSETTRAALAAAQGGLPRVSPHVAALMQNSAPTLSLGKAKLATLLLAMSLLGGLGLWLCRGSADLAPAALAAPPAAAEPAAMRKGDKSTKAAPPAQTAAKTVALQGRVLGPNGSPREGARLLLVRDGNEPRQLGKSAADGRFQVEVPRELNNHQLIAVADGAGMDFVELTSGAMTGPVELRLVKDRLIRGRVVTTEGKPVAGVRVTVNNVGIYANGSMDSFLATWKKRPFMSGIPGGVRHLWSGLGSLFTSTTDAAGRFVLRGLGDERLVGVRISGGGIAEDDLWIVTRARFDPKPYNQATLDNIPKGQDHLSVRVLLYGPELSAVAEIGKVLRGVVKEADTGKGRSGVLVQLTRSGNDLVRVILQARTDADGHYEIPGARKSRSYMLEVGGDTEAGFMPAQTWVNDSPGYQPIAAHITVKRGVIIRGKVLDGTTGKPVPGFAMAAVLNDNPYVKDYPSFDSSAWFPMHSTGPDGAFRVVAIPGAILLMGGPSSFHQRFQYRQPKADPKYPQYFDNREELSPTYYGPGGGISPIQGNWCKVLEIKPGTRVIEQDIVLERASILPV
jgi:RNA polymerase sigma factor (sigma-70 family)